MLMFFFQFCLIFYVFNSIFLVNLGVQADTFFITLEHPNLLKIEPVDNENRYKPNRNKMC